MSDALKAVLGLLAVVAVLAVGLIALGLGLGWFKAGTDVISADNVKTQYEFGYTYDRSMTALAGTWCSARQAEDAETNADNKSQRTTQRLAYENQYRSVQAQYDAAMANAFKAKHVKPADLPLVAPSLDQRVSTLGLRCG